MSCCNPKCIAYIHAQSKAYQYMYDLQECSLHGALELNTVHLQH